MHRVHRSIFRWGFFLLVAAAIVGAAGSFLREQLRPCAPLDLALRRSGCMKVIELPQMAGQPYVSVAPDGQRVAVTAPSADEGLTTVLVVDLATERVVEEYLISQIEHQQREALHYAIYSPDGKLTADNQSRKKINSVRSRDGETLISFVVRHPCFSIAIVEGETIVREIPISGQAPRLSQLALSHDDSRLAFSDRRFSAWELKTGALLIDLYDEAFSDVDWLPDNRTLIAVLSGRPVRVAFFELHEAASTPDQSAVPQCQPETDELRRWWIEG